MVEEDYVKVRPLNDVGCTINRFILINSKNVYFASSSYSLNLENIQDKSKPVINSIIC